jgi:hypothetical protein
MKPPFKRYILFEYELHDASGGLDDITGSYDTKRQAIAAARKNWGHDYQKVVDRDTWKIVWDADDYPVRHPVRRPCRVIAMGLDTNPLRIAFSKALAKEQPFVDLLKRSTFPKFP